MDRLESLALGRSLQNLQAAKSGSTLRLRTPRSEIVRAKDLELHNVNLMTSYLCAGKVLGVLNNNFQIDPPRIAQFIANHIEYTLARSANNVDSFGAYQATAHSVRDRLIEFWNDTQRHFEATKAKMCYYMSIGRLNFLH